MGAIVVIRQIAQGAISLFQALLVIRAILSWFPQVRLDKVNAFLYYATEPLMAPVRKFLLRFNALRYFPLDLSMLVVYIALEILSSLI